MTWGCQTRIEERGGCSDACPGCLCRSWELKALGDYHQHLLKMRLEGGLEGIEMGPILGRGSFGRVYKGTVPLPPRDSLSECLPCPALACT